MKENNDSNFTWNKKLIFFWKKNSKEDKNQYHNLLRRKESPQKRLFKAIKEALNNEEKIRKKIKSKTDLFFEEKNNSHYKKKNEQLLDINNKLDESDYSKENYSFNSRCAQYKMELSNFQDLNKNDEIITKQKKNLVNKINIKKDIISYDFHYKNISKNNNQTGNNKIKINQYNNKNFNNIINQKLSNSTRNLTNNFTNIIKKNNNKLSEINSFNKKVMPKSINYMNYKLINQSPSNVYKKGEFVLFKNKLYKSRFGKLSFNSQGNDSKIDLTKKITFFEYKPFYNTKEKSYILYNNKDNNSRQIN
jgi:hypothetical protein